MHKDRRFIGHLFCGIVLCVFLIPAVSGAIAIDTVVVGNAGNTASNWGYGAVAYEYHMGTYEVTAGQYTAFLNAVAATDAYSLYNPQMWSNARGCKIQRSGTAGSYSYTVAADYTNRPVNYVNWGDAVRFANWLHNGQPVGLQNADTTEDGAYTLNGAMTNTELLAITRNSHWKWTLTSEDEWYKAAYHKNNGVTGGAANYFSFPTQSYLNPGRDLNDSSGNNANFYGSPYPIDSGYYTTVVGAFENSYSAYGTFDQGGNVREWNEGMLGSTRGLRGGSFDLFASSMSASSYSGVTATTESYEIGFRVAAIPEPASLSLITLCGLTLRRLRR